jgi:hypothetical protein
MSTNNNSDELLKELLGEVSDWEQNLAGGTRLVGPAATAVDNLLKTRVEFGNPKDKLIYLSEQSFEESGVKLTETFREQMAEHYDFYSIALVINLRTQPSTFFKRLVCDLDFGPKGESEPIIQKIFPAQSWKQALELGVSMDLGLDGNLDWSAGVDSSSLGEFAECLPGELKANATSKNSFKANAAFSGFQYEFGDAEIVAGGEGNSAAYWRFESSKELKRISDVPLAVVFKVPKGTTSVKLQGVCRAEPNINVLAGDLVQVIELLSDKFKSLFSEKERAAQELARQAAEEWILELPRTVSGSP